MLSRRSFLQRCGLIAFAPAVPAFLPRLAAAAGYQRDSTILVVIQLDGGNDGLNTLVPYADDAYARSRPSLALPPQRVIKLDERAGLHPAMRPAAELLESGRLAVVQGVGYPNPSRSHFRSMRIWHTGRPDREKASDAGWIGGAFDGLRPSRGGPDCVYVGADDLPPALAGRRCVAATVSREEDLTAVVRPDVGGAMPAGDDDVAAFVRTSVLSAYAAAGDLAAAAGSDDRGTGNYPRTPLAQRLRLVARLIRSGVGTRVYYASQGGYDTHGAQQGQHAQLLSEFGGALKAFLDDLRGAGRADAVAVLAFSEFGRRVAENDSGGTDHGTAGPVFLAGDAVRPGLHGDAPSLTDLEDGDLKMTLDFRRVYAAIVRDWLAVPLREGPIAPFEPLGLFSRK
jgi:uncharacterized protein (DUF1501 family)